MRSWTKPSPAMVVACVALVTALGGVGVAATLITGANIKDGSVSSADIRNNNLRGVDVRDGTLGVQDLSASARAALRGNVGPAGPAGASSALSTYHDGGINIPATEATLVSLRVPAGKYVTFAKGVIFSSGTVIPICRLVAEADFDTTRVAFNPGPVSYQVPIALNVVHEFAGDGAVDLRCGQGNGTTSFAVSQVKITAIRVDSLSNVPG